jgi:hypothetical protein
MASLTLTLIWNEHHRFQCAERFTEMTALKFFVIASLKFASRASCEHARLKTHISSSAFLQNMSLTMITILNTLAVLRSLCMIRYGLAAMANAPNAFSSHSHQGAEKESSFTASSSINRTLNDPSSANRHDSKAGQLEALFIMQQYLQSSSSSSSGFRNRSSSTTFQPLTTNTGMAVARASDRPTQSSHTADQTVFTTTEVLKQKFFSDKEDDDDRLLNQILFASDDQTVSSAPFTSKTVANPTSEFTYEKEFAANKPDPDLLHHQYGNHSIGNAPSHQDLVENNVFNSMVWHPTYQPNHEEVVYNESIFSTETAHITAGVQPVELHPPMPSVTLRTVANFGGWTENSDASVALHSSNDTNHLAIPSSPSGTEALLYAAKLAGIPKGIPLALAPTQAASKAKPKGKKLSKALNERDEEIVNRIASNAASSEQESITKINMTFIPHHEITENDVLLGRGGRTNHHVGNKYYLEYKSLLQEQYLRADKDEKTSLSQKLVQKIHDRKGRFLKLADPELIGRAHCDLKRFGSSQLWYEVNLAVARRKASQTLRELNTPELRAAKRAKYAK